jgi:hypothetical protein
LVGKSGRSSTISKVNVVDTQLSKTNSGHDDDWPGVHRVLSSQKWETVLVLGRDNNQPQPPTIRYLEVQPYNAAALSDRRSVLEDVMQCRRMLYKRASVLTISMGPDYPGLVDSFPIGESH